MTDWQDISTAPKGGPYLIWGKVNMAFPLHEPIWEEPTWFIALWGSDGDDEFEVYAGFVDGSTSTCKATNWRPLPSPPSEV